MRSPFEEINGDQLSEDRIEDTIAFLAKILMILVIIGLSLICYALEPKFRSQLNYDALGRSDCYAEGC